MFFSRDAITGEVSLIETRPCGGCKHYKRLIDGSICRKHLMGVLPDMKVTYMERNGTCWEARAPEPPSRD